MRQRNWLYGILEAMLLALLIVAFTIARPATTQSATLSSVCPTYWTCSDIGAPTLSGGQSLSGDTWTVQGSGGDIWGTADQFHYVWQALSGDGSISAHVILQTNTDPWAKAGVMLRQSTNARDPFYDAMVTPGNGISVQYRATAGGSAVQAANIPRAVPVYLKVTRSGSTYTAYTSSDGSTWTAVAGSSVPISMSGAVLAGMAATSHNVGGLSTATFDTVSVSPSPAATSTITNALLTPTPTRNFVTVCGTSLCLNGRKLVVKGATAYGQYTNAVNEISLAKQEGINVLELVEFDSQYHVLSDTESFATWNTVDDFIAEASQGGLHVILNLSEYGQSLAASGQVPTAVDWGPYLSFVANRVNTVTGVRYADDPTIAMVELYGEIDAPNYGQPTAGTTSEMNSFFQRSLAEWKSLAPSILVSSGGFSYINDQNSGIDWKTIMSDPNDATCDVEVNSYSDRNISVPNVSSYCQGLGKPWFLAAWSSCNNTSTWSADDINDWPTDSAVATHAQDMYNLSKNNNPTSHGPAMAALGNDFWNLASTPARIGSCDIGPQYPITFQTVRSN